METHQIWVFVHIMLLVYWLGADLGVFILAQKSKNAALSVETRAKMLEAAMLIDLLPRLCFALMPAVGLMLAGDLGLLRLPAWVTAAAWVYGLCWCVLILLSLGWEGKPAGQAWQQANLGVQVVLGGLFLWAAIGSLGGQGPLAPGWLIWKTAAFGLIYFAAIMIDVAFRPGVLAFGAIATNGSTPALEGTFSRSVDHTCIWVVIVYALVIAAAFLGTMQPA